MSSLDSSSPPKFIRVNVPFTSPDDPLCPLPLDAVSYTSKLWRNKKDLYVFFMRSHPQQDVIMQWAEEWSKYSAVIFHKTTSRERSDIRIDFSEGLGSSVCMQDSTNSCTCTCRPTHSYWNVHANGGCMVDILCLMFHLDDLEERQRTT